MQMLPGYFRVTSGEPQVGDRCWNFIDECWDLVTPRVLEQAADVGFTFNAALLPTIRIASIPAGFAVVVSGAVEAGDRMMNGVTGEWQEVTEVMRRISAFSSFAVSDYIAVVRPMVTAGEEPTSFTRAQGRTERPQTVLSAKNATAESALKERVITYMSLFRMAGRGDNWMRRASREVLAEELEIGDCPAHAKYLREDGAFYAAFKDQVEVRVLAAERGPVPHDSWFTRAGG